MVPKFFAFCQLSTTIKRNFSMNSAAVFLCIAVAFVVSIHEAASVSPPGHPVPYCTYDLTPMCASPPGPNLGNPVRVVRADPDLPRRAPVRYHPHSR